MCRACAASISFSDGTSAVLFPRRGGRIPSYSIGIIDFSKRLRSLKANSFSQLLAPEPHRRSILRAAFRNPGCDRMEQEISAIYIRSDNHPIACCYLERYVPVGRFPLSTQVVSFGGFTGRSPCDTVHPSKGKIMQGLGSIVRCCVLGRWLAIGGLSLCFFGSQLIGAQSNLESDVDNARIIEMTHKGLGDDVIIARIKASATKFEPLPEPRIPMRNALLGVRQVLASLESVVTGLANKATRLTPQSNGDLGQQRSAWIAWSAGLQRLQPALAVREDRPPGEGCLKPAASRRSVQRAPTTRFWGWIWGIPLIASGSNSATLNTLQVSAGRRMPRF